ncbi:MAG: hypothetical protein ABJR46_16365 [Tateyamaria sp.]|uniref:hypothetical protein n=1 Tax=Tateyamaria sp. TaxID=1929288 RepID=UPI00329F0693
MQVNMDYNSLTNVSLDGEFRSRSKTAEVTAISKALAGDMRLNHIDISLVHRHFSLSPDEKVVRVVSEKELRASAVKEHEDLLGAAWKCDLNGRWRPYEYVDAAVSSPLYVERCERLAHLLSDSNPAYSAAFAGEYCDVYGLSPSLEGIIDVVDKTPIELTDVNARISSIKARNKKDYSGHEITQTAWKINVDPGHATISCSVYCINCR